MDHQLLVQHFFLRSLFTGIGEGKGPVLVPQFCVKGAQFAGSDVQRGQRCLDGNGTAAAEGIGKDLSTLPTAQFDHGCGQRLAQGGIVLLQLIAALVQRCAGGVQEDLAQIVHQGELDLVLGTGFLQPSDVISQFHTLNGSLFQNTLTVGHTMQLGVQGETLDGECIILAQPLFPMDGLHTLEQLVKGLGRIGCQTDEHALAAAQQHIGTGAVIQVTLKEYAAVFCLHVFKALVLQFVGYQTLYAHQAGDYILIHGDTSCEKNQILSILA